MLLVSLCRVGIMHPARIGKDHHMFSVSLQLPKHPIKRRPNRPLLPPFQQPTNHQRYTLSIHYLCTMYILIDNNNLWCYRSIHRRECIYLCVFFLQKVKGGKGKKGNGVSTPFRRVEGDVEVDPRLVDNSFEAKVITYYFV